MAYDLKLVGGYGTAVDRDVEVSDGALETINSYARVQAIDELDDYKIVLDETSLTIGTYETFKAGTDIMLHVSTSPTETEYLGKYMVATIRLVGNGILTLDKPFTDLLPRDQFNFYSVQAITIANFDCLKLLEGGVIMPPVYSPYKMCGGILIFRCWDSLIFRGGHINLADCGIPSNRKHLLRPLTNQETAANGESDVSKLSGQENFITAERFLLNAGDGAAYIIAKNIYGNADSRIGNVETHGAHFCRGAENSVGVKPSNITNVGGSTILIAAENIYNFSPKMIAKYRKASTVESEIGRGLCRCYIASNTILRNDEGLYSYDVLKNPNRISEKLNIHNFGEGNYGSIKNPQKALNNYAQVIAINQGGCRLRIANETVSGLTPILEGTKILVQVIQKSELETEHAGEIVTAKILSRNENSIVIDFPAPKVDLEKYQMQIISVPQFENFTLNQNYTATTAFNGTVGGVFAIAVNNECDISDGKINVEGKGGANPYGSNGLEYIGNAQDNTKLPLGSGHGSVFILAKTLKLSDNSRIGATYSGLGTGGRLGGSNEAGTNVGGGYSGAYDEEGNGSAGGYNGGGASTSKVIGGMGGSGASGGTSENINELERDKICGGYGSNGKSSNGYEGGKQGAHLMIIAEQIENFSQACFSTGGEGGKGKLNAPSGGAGYGGGASESSGGSSGWCFIYTA